MRYPIGWRLVDELRYQAWALCRRVGCFASGGHVWRPWMRLGPIEVEFRVCSRCPAIQERRAPFSRRDVEAAERLAAAVAARLRDP